VRFHSFSNDATDAPTTTTPRFVPLARLLDVTPDVQFRTVHRVVPHLAYRQLRHGRGLELHDTALFGFTGPLVDAHRGEDDFAPGYGMFEVVFELMTEQ
jgi:hypothetical protein